MIPLSHVLRLFGIFPTSHGNTFPSKLFQTFVSLYRVSISISNIYLYIEYLCVLSLLSLIELHPTGGDSIFWIGWDR